MPFAPQIRKYILQALDRSIIPALQNVAVPQIIAAPPFDFSQVEHWTLRQKYLAHKNPEPTQIEWAWNNEHLVASRMPFIGFVYEGVADDKVGITTRMAKGLDQDGTVPRGITALRLSAPATICFPPGTPHHDGSEPYCETRHPGFTSARTLWMHISSDELLVHYCESDVGKIYSSHSLQIKDVLLTQLAHAYVDELHYARQEGNEGTQGLLLSMTKRLRRHLATHSVPLSNSAWPFRHLTQQGQTQFKSKELCQRTTEYIHMHLQDSLTWEILAGQMGVSPFYLNHVFRKTTGMPVMRYVNFLRIEAAKLMLFSELERVSDIARLVGFSSVASFSASFKRHAGHTPSEFRHQSTKINMSKSTFNNSLK